MRSALNPPSLTGLPSEKTLASFRKPPIGAALRASAALFVLVALYVSFLTRPEWIWISVPLYCVVLLYFGLIALHEACHGTLSEYRWVNLVFAHGFDILVGISSQQYRIKHMIHHSYTNIDRWDNDLDTDGALRLSPKEAWRPYHRYQALYAPFLYALITITWGPYYDLKRLWTGTIGKKKVVFKRSDIAIQLGLKFVHFFIFLYLPYRLYGLSAIGTYFVAHAFFGIAIALIFQVAHITSDCAFFDESKKVTQWDSHQVATSANFSTDSSFSNFFFGGLNYQGIHHLYPNISYLHFPRVNRELKAKSVKLIEYPSFTRAAFAHFKHLNQMGRRP